MEVQKLYKYTVEGHSDLNEFALGILALVNFKSSRKNSITSIRTFEGSNTVVVKSLIPIDYYIKAYLGKILFVDYDVCANLEYTDLKMSEDDMVEEVRKEQERIMKDHPEADDLFDTQYVFEIDEQY